MLAYLFLRFAVLLIRFIPFRALYAVSDGLAFLLRDVIRYRKAVIEDNLRQAFPEKTETELRQISRDTYRNLTDITLESLKSQTSPVEEIVRRCRALNPEIVTAFMEQGRTVIIAGSHNGNWEYAGLVLPLSLSGHMYGVYKPMSNKVIDKYVSRMRERAGTVTVPMDDVIKVVRRQIQAEGWSVMLIADQSPNSRKRAHWVPFFGRETACLPGVDVLARTFSLPVFRYEIRRVRRGFYEVVFEPLWLEPNTAKEGDITIAYTEKLEQEIRKNPANWLWSHKRWKMKREPGDHSTG